jgi:hypothetical protein
VTQNARSIHGKLLTLLSELLHLVAVLDLVDKDLRRLEAGDEMFVDNNGSVARDVAGDLLLPLFVDETAKAADVDVLAA